jgi:hypothetical protein
MPQRPTELQKKQRFSSTAETMLTLQVGVRVLFFFGKKIIQKKKYFIQ